MRQIIQRVTAAFRRTPQPTTAPGLTARIDEFMAAVPTQRRIELRMATLQYETAYTTLMRRFDASYDRDTPEYHAFYHAQLTCAGCNWEFPGSYTSSLIGLIGPDTPVAGGTRGFREFGKTGKCTRCGSLESLLVYEVFPPSEIDADDMAAFVTLWRADAEKWWSATDRQTAICDLCNADVPRNEGYLVSRSDLRCVSCTEPRIAEGLAKLRANPYYFGATELRRARAFRKRTR